MTRTLLRLAALMATLAAIILAGGTVAHATTRTSVPSTGGLVVTPGQSAFDVTLQRGRPEAREVTITNTSDRDLAVQLTVALSDQAPADHRLGHLRLHATGVYTSCDPRSADGAPTVPLANAKRLDQESVSAHSSRTVCLSVMMPADAPALGAARTIVDLRFHAITTGSDRSPGELAFTGTDLARLITAAALALLGLLAGIVLMGTLRRTALAVDLDETDYAALVADAHRPEARV